MSNALTKSAGAAAALFKLRPVRFVVVGGAATATHAAALAALVEIAGIRPAISAVGAFLVAFLVSYGGHYYITFQSTQPHRETLVRYAFIACLGAAMNYAIFAIINEGLGASYWFAFAAAIIAVPPVIFTLSRSQVFNRS